MKRKRAETDTAAQKAARACRAHLRDLRAYEWPPAGVAIPSTAIPLRIAPDASGSRSPAQACAELGWRWAD